MELEYERMREFLSAYSELPVGLAYACWVDYLVSL